MIVPPVGYPMCKKCNDGNLVPFYSPDGRNVYFCTNCKTRFTAYVDEPEIDKKQIFLDSAQYISSDEIIETNPDTGSPIESNEEPDMTEIDSKTEEAKIPEDDEPTNEIIEAEQPMVIEVIEDSEPDEGAQDSIIGEDEPIALGPRTELSEPMNVELDSDYQSIEEDSNVHGHDGEEEQIPETEPDSEVQVDSIEVDPGEDVDEQSIVEDDIEQHSEEIEVQNEPELDQVNEVEEDRAEDSEVGSHDTTGDVEFETKEEPEESIDTPDTNISGEEDVDIAPTLEGFPTEEPDVPPEQENDTGQKMELAVDEELKPEEPEFSRLATPDIPYAQPVGESDLVTGTEIKDQEIEQEQIRTEIEGRSIEIETTEMEPGLEHQEEPVELEEQKQPEEQEEQEQIEPSEIEEQEPRKLPEGVEPIEEPEQDEPEEDSEKPEKELDEKTVDDQENIANTIPDTINLDGSDKGDQRLQNLLKEFELPVIKNQQDNKIEIQTPEDKADNIEVYKKLVQKYKSENNGEIEHPVKEKEELE
jgi:hypothetical protein